MVTAIERFRAGILFVLFTLCYTIIIAHLYHVQIVQAPFFENLAKQQYHLTTTQNPPRAPIYDRSGKQFLAHNKQCLSAFITPRSINDLKKLNSFLRAHFPTAYEMLPQKKDKHFMYIKRHLNESEIKKIQSAQLPDIYFLTEQRRYYPVASTGTIVGLTDIDNNGLFGIELQYNQQLAGTPTTFFLEKDARSGHFYLSKHTMIAGKEGTPIQLTLDADLQFLIDEELKTWLNQMQSKEGAVLIMDPASGDIVSMVCYPHFNPNATEIVNQEETKNKIITETYELGSVIKVCCALAALAEGIVTPDELIDCTGLKSAYIDGRLINTVHPAGIIPFTEVIVQSNNIGIAQVAKRLGPKIYDHYMRMGFGKKTNIDFPGEQKGFVNPPNKWSKQSIISLSYGYEITASLLQLACFFCLIANNGVPITPSLIKKSKPDHPKDPVYPATIISSIKDILLETTEHGTTKRARIKGYSVMSKTGTANTLVNGIYDQHKNIYTCAGIVQKGDYKRVIVTFVKEATGNNLYASTVAAPLFEKVASKMIIHERAL
jgi:cell division protein FtsI (penicillin-binding protein 3)